MSGDLITIEGIDGSGKGTQARILLEKLSKLSIPTKLYSFPCYEETFFGKEIGAYLRGEFGTLDNVPPKFASILFAGDRFERKIDIEKDINEGFTVICDRYVDSNIAHQCAKLSADKQQELSEWIEELEYTIFGMPKPDITFFLNTPSQITKNLVLGKVKRNYTDKKEDIHESSYTYLENVYRVYRDLIRKRNWIEIDCTIDSAMRSIDSINNEIISHITKQNGARNNARNP